MKGPQQRGRKGSEDPLSLLSQGILSMKRRVKDNKAFRKVRETLTGTLLS
jgi:hypothetical protein